MAITIENKPAPTENDVKAFLNAINFSLPVGFIEFFKETNGAEINGDENFVALWPLTEMVELNKTYKVDEYAPDFFFIGSNGGDEAYAIEKETGHIYEIPFIGMYREDAVFQSKTFKEFIELLK